MSPARSWASNCDPDARSVAWRAYKPHPAVYQPAVDRFGGATVPGQFAPG
jgi:hypothetical protein